MAITEGGPVPTPETGRLTALKERYSQERTPQSDIRLSFLARGLLWIANILSLLRRKYSSKA